MPTQKKIDLVDELAESIQRSVITIAADYSGLTVPEMSKLRQAIREAGVSASTSMLRGSWSADLMPAW